jgi:HTH-type transcriptional repressor of NAD biosynthesis genes
MIGLTLGKFMPLHKGHLALIEFAAAQCERLLVLVCASDQEDISGEMRLDWVRATTRHLGNVEPVLFPYNEALLPNTSVSSQSVSEVWAMALKSQFPEVDTFFSSEPYGEFVAQSWGIAHISFDPSRQFTPISATQIRATPLRYWDFLPDVVKPFFVQKVGILGTESTGKSTLAAQLAKHFKTEFVPEMARQVLGKSEDCTPEDLYEIAKCHADMIQEKANAASKWLFLDTTVHITQSYAQFSFGTSDFWKNAPFAASLIQQIEAANRCALYLYLEADAPFVQDGTRLDEASRNRLDVCHQATLERQNIPFHRISGTWHEQFEQACRLVERLEHR